MRLPISVPPQPSSASHTPATTIPTSTSLTPTIPTQPKVSEATQRKNNKKTSRTADDSTATTTATTPSQPSPTIQPQESSSTRPQRHVTAKSWKDGPVHLRDYLAFRMSLQSALRDNDRKDAAMNAVKEEVDNMMDMKVMTALKYQDIPKHNRGNIIPLHMFLKEKYKSDGSFDRLKARLVANGNFESPESLSDTYAPTVNPISVMTVLNVAAAKGHLISAYDIKSAFLMTKILGNKSYHVKLPSNISKHWINWYPNHRKYLHSDGCIYFKLNKYLYGLCEAPNRFNNMLTDYLVNVMGFKKCKADPCLYTLTTKDGIMYVAIHVDDILLSSPTRELQQHFEEMLAKRFEITTQRDNISYLGLNISKKNNCLHITQDKHIKELVEKYEYDNLLKYPKTPTAADFLSEDPDSPLVDKSKYLSLIMSLMYIGRLTRPDILMPVSYLATKSSSPTFDDYCKALRIVKYLAGTSRVAVVYTNGRALVPALHVDASHILHQSGHGHGGLVLTLGFAVVYSRSFKLQTITRSSSESELVALDDSLTYAVWYRDLLEDLGYPLSDPIVTYQDNKSTIIMASMGGTFKRSKHIQCKYGYIQEQIRNKKVILQYIPSEKMCADMLTKPLNGPALARALEAISISSKIEK